jgi:hypothetical protein
LGGLRRGEIELTLFLKGSLWKLIEEVWGEEDKDTSKKMS